jgi:hypothetical protein
MYQFQRYQPLSVEIIAVIDMALLVCGYLFMYGETLSGICPQVAYGAVIRAMVISST